MTTETMQLKATPKIQELLNRDPRVVEYTLIPEAEWEPEHFDVLYTPRLQVAAIYRANARELGIKELA